MPSPPRSCRSSASCSRAAACPRSSRNAHASGLSAQADSWVGTGENQPVSGQEIKGVVGDDAVKEVAQQPGISEDEAADVLAKVVPHVVSGLTPAGQVPSEDELSQLAAKFGA